jgi:hypothetical protein
MRESDCSDWKGQRLQIQEWDEVRIDFLTIRDAPIAARA